MAESSIAISAGSGTPVAMFVDPAGFDRQVVIVGDATLAATQAVDVNGSAAVLARRDLVQISVATTSLTISTTAYTAGDQVATQFTFANAARASGGTGVIIGAVLISAADITGPYDLVVTDASVTLAGDNNAYAISDADALHVIGVVQMAAAFDIGNNRIAQLFNCAIPYVCTGSTSLFGSLITRAGHTFFAANSDLQMILYVERN